MGEYRGGVDLTFGYFPIAFSCYVNGKGQIYVMNADGSIVRNTSNNDFCDKTPQWSSDGKTIAFSSDMDSSGYHFIHTVPAEGGRVKRLDATINPTGKNNFPRPIRGSETE